MAWKNEQEATTSEVEDEASRWSDEVNEDTSNLRGLTTSLP